MVNSIDRWVEIGQLGRGEKERQLTENRKRDSGVEASKLRVAKRSSCEISSSVCVPFILKLPRVP
jgi:hypothetical protein